jgi:hypothetical protein
MPPWLRLGLLLTAGTVSGSAFALEVTAGPPTDVAVTVYRAPFRASGSLDLNRLSGFALVSEKRLVSVPAGVTRVRFEGVADGIEAASTILTGLPEALLEKNRDAHVLSPAELVSSAIGDKVILVRTDPKTGATKRTTATLRSHAGGVVFETAEGIEALRCSGLAETFTFDPATDLPATPALSVLVHSASPLTVTVTLAYLAHGFDWTANYIATLAPDGKTMDLGAWVTLANGNGISFASAQTQVVAGRLNRESGEVEPFDTGGEILAQCWPRGSTSDVSQALYLQRATPDDLMGTRAAREMMMPMAAAAVSMAVAAQRVQEEQLGDLKLYRVPERTTVSSRQSKQVRLLDRRSIPVTILYRANLPANENVPEFPAERFLRTRNDAAHALALPLPSGQVASFLVRGDASLLVAESPLRDVALDEQFELSLGDSPDVQVEAVREHRSIPASGTAALPLLPGMKPWRSARVDDVNRVEIHNARADSIRFELRVQLPDGARVIGADHALHTRDGQPLFELRIPAGSRETIRYQTEHTEVVPRSAGCPTSSPCPTRTRNS